MIWRLFRKRPAAAAPDHGWWQQADAVAETPDADALARLRSSVSRAANDDVERVEEMLDGLDQVVAMAAADLPVLVTQHRVIGHDACHLVTPATLLGETAAPGKLFLTSTRLVFAGAGAQSWPWHRIRQVARAGRDLIVLTGADSGVRFQCNSYGDAMLARHVAARLLPQRPR